MAALMVLLGYIAPRSSDVFISAHGPDYLWLFAVPILGGGF